MMKKLPQLFESNPALWARQQVFTDMRKFLFLLLPEEFSHVYAKYLEMARLMAMVHDPSISQQQKVDHLNEFREKGKALIKYYNSLPDGRAPGIPEEE